MTTGGVLIARSGRTTSERMAQKQKLVEGAAPRKRVASTKPSNFVLGPRHETRDRLLAATVEYLEDHGVADLSLRQLAEKLGTSHRLLIYHFGDKEGLMVAVVEEIERIQRRWLESMWQRDLTPMELLHRAWERTSDPKLDRQLRLFVEIYGHALQGHAHTKPLLDTLVGAWLDPLSDLFKRMGMSSAEARTHARLNVATMRGLMLDLLTTGDRKATQTAFEKYVGQYSKLPGANKHEGRRKRG